MIPTKFNITKEHLFYHQTVYKKQYEIEDGISYIVGNNSNKLYAICHLATQEVQYVKDIGMHINE